MLVLLGRYGNNKCDSNDGDGDDDDDDGDGRDDDDDDDDDPHIGEDKGSNYTFPIKSWLWIAATS